MSFLDETERETLEQNSDDSDYDGEGVSMTIGNAAYYGSNKDDPNIIAGLPDSDDEDMEVLPDDNLIVIGRAKRDFCSLEVYVHNEKDNNCWCHHEMMLPTIPLCLEWLNFDGGEEKPGNMLAVGSVSPDIEIWDLDVVNALEPAFTLAGAKEEKKSKKKKLSVAGHKDAVLDLSWNKSFTHALASGSADQTAGLWDLSELKLISSIEHPEKVQSLQWQPSEPQSLLTGCADSTVNLFDCRSMEPTKKTWKVDGEVETVLWNVSNPQYFLAGTDIGTLYYIDSRTDQEVYKFNAHADGVSSIAQSVLLPNCFVSSGSDKYINVWNINESEYRKVFSKKMNMGQLFSVSNCPDSRFLFAVAGEQEFRILDLAKNPEIPAGFGSECKEGEASDIEVPIGHGDDGNHSGANSDNEMPMESAAKKPKMKKKKAARKLQKENGETNDSADVTHGATALEEEKSDPPSAAVTKKKNKKKKKKQHLK